MCDSLCAFQPDRTLFAKSSDRPPREPQVIESYRPRAPAPELRTQYLTITDAGAGAVLGSRPDWLWGLEHGINEHRVAVGNEQLWTVDDPSSSPEAFTGMDLVRLALERGRSAEEALDVVTGLIDRHGQGGVGDRDAGKAYYSSFLFADPGEAWVLESSDRSWAARRVDRAEQGVALSNRISLSTDWTRASTDVVDADDFDRWRKASSPTAHADKRLSVTGPGARSVAAGNDASAGARELAAVLRDHGGERWGRPGGDDGATPTGLPPAVIDRLGTGVSLCMHLTGVQATTSSMIASLPRADDEPVRSWVAPGNPCVAVFVPTFGLDGVAPELADPTTWHRFEALRDRVEQARAADPDGGGQSALAAVRAVLDPVEAELWDEADALVASPPDVRRRWAVGLGPRLTAALDQLGA